MIWKSEFYAQANGMSGTVFSNYLEIIKMSSTQFAASEQFSSLATYTILWEQRSHIYYIQEFLFSLSRIFHVSAACLRAKRSHPRSHVHASVDRHTLQWLVNLHSGDFVAT